MATVSNSLPYFPLSFKVSHALENVLDKANDRVRQNSSFPNRTIVVLTKATVIVGSTINSVAAIVETVASFTFCGMCTLVHLATGAKSSAFQRLTVNCLSYSLCSSAMIRSLHYFLFVKGSDSKSADQVTLGKYSLLFTTVATAHEMATVRFDSFSNKYSESDFTSRRLFRDWAAALSSSMKETIQRPGSSFSPQQKTLLPILFAKKLGEKEAMTNGEMNLHWRNEVSTCWEETVTALSDAAAIHPSLRDMDIAAFQALINSSVQGLTSTELLERLNTGSFAPQIVERIRELPGGAHFLAQIASDPAYAEIVRNILSGVHNMLCARSINSNTLVETIRLFARLNEGNYPGETELVNFINRHQPQPVTPAVAPAAISNVDTLAPESVTKCRAPNIALSYEGWLKALVQTAYRQAYADMPALFCSQEIDTATNRPKEDNRSIEARIEDGRDNLSSYYVCHSLASYTQYLEIVSPPKAGQLSARNAEIGRLRTEISTLTALEKRLLVSSLVATDLMEPEVQKLPPARKTLFKDIQRRVQTLASIMTMTSNGRNSSYEKDIKDWFNQGYEAAVTLSSS